MEPAAKQKVIHITYLIAALDITWLFLQFSITPYLARRLGFDTIWFGYLQTTVGVIQLLGGPIYGRFADVFGARAALTVSCLASVVYFLLLAVADNTFMLFVHKLPAVFMHALPGNTCLYTLTYTLLEHTVYRYVRAFVFVCRSSNGGSRSVRE